MNVKKKYLNIIILLSVLLAVFAGLFIYRARNSKPVLTIRTSGIIDGPEVNLAPKVAGKISEICCREGEFVREGQVAIRLESDDLTASVEQAIAGIEKAKADIKTAEATVENSRANIKNAEADIKSAEADLEKAKVQMDQAKREADRATALYKNEYISKESLDQAKAASDASVANYRSSLSRLNGYYSRKEAAIAQLSSSLNQMESSKAGLKAADANLAFNRSKLNDSTIISTVSGVIIFRPMEKGETVSPGSTVLTVVDMANLYVRADIDETKIGPVTLNAPAAIRVEGLPDKIFEGKVMEIGRYGDFATQRDVVRGRQDIKTFRIKISVEDPDRLLKPGMTVEAEIQKKG